MEVPIRCITELALRELARNLPAIKMDWVKFSQRQKAQSASAPNPPLTSRPDGVEGRSQLPHLGAV